MAKFMPGPTIGMISGSIGSTTFARNRYGVYIRTRSKPTQPNTSYQLNIRSHLSNISQQWASLDDSERLAWASWATTNPRTDRLGQSQVLQGNAAYIAVNHRLAQIGATLLDLPPLDAPPSPLSTLSFTSAIGTTGVKIVFTPTPTGASVGLMIWAAVSSSAGQNYTANLLKLINITAGAYASETEITSLIEARFGDLQVGQILTLQVATMDRTTGLCSQPLVYRAALEAGT